MNIWGVFLTGLFTGGLTCLAVQGGLLATTIAQQQEKKGNAVPILFFLSAKLLAYASLGFLLGWLGSVAQLSLQARTILQFAVGFFMVGTALNMLEVHPVFRYFAIQPPAFLARFVRKQTKSKELAAPALLGAFTVFIPCGTTQAMMAIAIATGNPLAGAAVMFAFTLGTSPVFFLLGYFATRLSTVLQAQFMHVVAYAILLLALYNINGAIALTGSPWTFEAMGRDFYCTALTVCDGYTSPMTKTISQTTETTALLGKDTTITIETAGYVPNKLAVKKSSAVTLKIVNKNGAGCTQAFTIPKFGIQKIIPVGMTDTIQFTAPNEPQQIPFMCSMGMYTGVIDVI